ncbi:MAG: hypothetical protein KF880_02930 [Ferruginibacter sp.]|nr:hypothetical protein [Ferruginibacter sp.]
MQKVLTAAVIAIFMLIAGCKKGDKLPTGDFPDLNTRVNASASGFVTNEQNQPVQGAIVKMGMMSTTTNLFGYFEFNDVEVVKNAALIKVENPGYFTAIKTHSVITGEKFFTRIKLIPKNTLGTIDAITGGSVTDVNGFKIQIQPNSVVYDGSGLPYNGAITVFGYWLNPVSDDLPLTMPGDLRALNNNGNLQSLITYGMVAVELKGSNGEALQIASGKTSAVTFPIPSPLNNSAPATIPLWYFDENNGHWVEEGVANRVGDFYVGEASHFSFWNCDVPENRINFSITIKSPQGIPLPNFCIVFQSTTPPFPKRVYYTNLNGFTSGFLPKNTNMIMEVKGTTLCSNVIYTQPLITTESNLDLGEVIIPENIYYTSLTGTVVNCTNQPVTNGAVLVLLSSGYQTISPIQSNGQFNINVPLCSSNEQATLITSDYSSNIQNNPVTIMLNENENNMGNIEICNESNTVNQFLRYSIQGITYEFVSTNSNITIWN